MTSSALFLRTQKTKNPQPFLLRLMMRLSKKVRVVMTDDYRYTKAYPVCQDCYSKMNFQKLIQSSIEKRVQQR